jgi:16S rRNA U516 pseudouridylate synthase RsuA-like enzyme
MCPSPPPCQPTTTPSSITGIWKRYRVSLDKPLVGKEAAAAVRRFASGALQLVGDRSPLLPAGLTMVDEVTAEVALCEGRYHQVGNRTHHSSSSSAFYPTS